MTDSKANTQDSSNMISDTDDHGELRAFILQTIKSAMKEGEKKGESEVAKIVKESLDKNWGPCWSVVVGSDFKIQCSHIAKSFLFTYEGKVAICVFRTAF
eukprot:g3322.t1